MGREMFRVADHTFCIDTEEKRSCRGWRRIAWHFEPFKTDGTEEPLFMMRIKELAEGEAFPHPADGMRLIYSDTPEETGTFGNDIYCDERGALLFRLRFPGSDVACGLIEVDEGRRGFRITIKEDARTIADSGLTMSLLLCFMIATNNHGTLTMHSSCVKHEGKAYLFLGKSGTGKSTHSRLWLKNLEGSVLLNDDHPILRVSDDGRLTAYGSPWSGKTDCYVDDAAPVGAIVKIEQAPENRIRRLSPLEAYMKIATSASKISWIREMADCRHATIEQAVRTTPCYELECLPDDDAARVCFGAVTEVEDC